ncbi:unnamed protein product, partial (macronuclear) [Paramecium tetraurelia]
LRTPKPKPNPNPNPNPKPKPNEAISINPKYVDAWNNKGIALYNLKKFEEAIQCYEKVISINPKDEQAINIKGLLLQELQNDLDALSCFEQAIQIQTSAIRLKNKGYQSLIFLADSLFELRRKSEAKYFYFAAQELGLDQNAYIKSQLSKL